MTPHCGTAEQLVAGEEGEVSARRDALLRHRLMGDAVGCRVQQTPAAQVVEQEEVALVGHLRELGYGWGAGEADDLEVGGVHGQDGRRLLGDGALEVGGVGAVGGADLDEGGAGLGEDVWDAEASADLDGLTAGDYDLSAGGDGREG